MAVQHTSLSLTEIKQEGHLGSVSGIFDAVGTKEHEDTHLKTPQLELAWVGATEAAPAVTAEVGLGMGNVKGEEEVVTERIDERSLGVLVAERGFSKFRCRKEDVGTDPKPVVAIRLSKDQTRYQSLLDVKFSVNKTMVRDEFVVVGFLNHEGQKDIVVGGEPGWNNGGGVDSGVKSCPVRKETVASGDESRTVLDKLAIRGVLMTRFMGFPTLISTEDDDGDAAICNRGVGSGAWEVRLVYGVVWVEERGVDPMVVGAEVEIQGE
ncbi:hypothetical protein BV25DRAFT_1843200 [Artomyces pyxidatus]|uniref:Uncharacterized protein n=1 Tax=Artomyces pyxidatus TaxID=48021 RepID=A0ACB8SGM5_9AGAM|nr:hypothetical protein BV25DRAFT_1843200 [Artomyces pyxidatus]